MIRVQHEDFDAAAETGRLASGRSDIGGIASFVGLVRGGTGGVTAMTLEHYPGMTERQLAAIEAEARRRWKLLDVAIIHRHGRLLPGERIVFVAVAAAHRGEAFAACAFLVDWLKTRAPFWKLEEGPAGARWVEARDEDEREAERWGVAQAEGHPFDLTKGGDTMTIDGLITIPSTGSARATADRAAAAIAARGLTLFARIDHAAGAQQAGMALRPTEVLIFGAAKAGTPLMQAAQTIGIDLPLRLLVWEDEAGKVFVGLNDPAWLARRHGLDEAARAAAEAMRAGLVAIGRAAAGAA